MSGVFLLLLGFLLTLGAVLALGSGVGYLLHWVLPDVELGMALLVGTAMSGLALHVFVQLFRSFLEFRLTESHDEWGEEEDEEKEEVVVQVPQRRKLNRRQ